MQQKPQHSGLAKVLYGFGIAIMVLAVISGLAVLSMLGNMSQGLGIYGVISALAGPLGGGCVGSLVFAAGRVIDQLDRSNELLTYLAGKS